MPETAQLRSTRLIEWQPIRDAFVNRTPLPSYTELSGEFAVSPQSISRCANEENWAELRLTRVQNQLKEAGASELILKAIQGEGQLLQKSRELATKFCTTAELLLEELTNQKEGDSKISTRISTLNNLGFALSNISRFIEAVGLVGMPQDLRNAKRAGVDSAGQPWEKGMLQQINVTVKNIQAAAEATKAEPAPVDLPKADGAPEF